MTRTAARASRSPAGPTAPRWVRTPAWAGSSSSTSWRACSALDALGLLALAPGVDDEVVGGLAQADRRHLRQLGPEQVRAGVGVAAGAHRAEHLGAARGIHHLLDPAGDLGVALPLIRVARPGMQREARVALEVARLD